MEGLFGIFFVFIIIFWIYGNGVLFKSNSSSKEATQALEREKYKLFAIENRILNIQEKIESLLKEDGGDTGAVAVPVAKLLKDFYAAHKEYEEQVKTYDSAHQNAYEALNTHRMAQNRFGGGADDLVALAYYKNEKNYHKAAYARGVRVDGILIMRATEYVRAHSERLAYMEDDTGITENEQRYAETKNEESSSSRKNELTAYVAENAGKKEKRSGGFGKKVAIAGSIFAVAALAVAFWAINGSITDQIGYKTSKHGKLQPLSTSGYEDNSHDIADDEAEIANDNVASVNSPEESGEGQGESAPETVQENETTGYATYQTVGRYNMRTDVNGAIIRTLESGTICYGTGNASTDNKWLEISLADGTVGWIFRDGLAALDNQPEVAVAEPVNGGEIYENDQSYAMVSQMVGGMKNMAEQMGGEYADMAENINVDTYMDLFNSMASGF